MVKRHFNKNLKMTDEDMDDINRSNKCYICNEKYVEGVKPIKDHCRITENYLGSAHDACCSKLRMNPDKIRVPVIFHNLRGYDSHLIMQQIGKIAKNKSYVDKNGERKDLKINTYQTHIDCGYGYKVVCHYDWKLSKRSKIYRGKGAVYKFMENMLEEVEYCKRMVKRHFNKNLKMTDEDMDDINRSNKCYICNEKYVEGVKHIKDHCRITENYLGSAHDACCSKLRMNPDKIRVPVIFHNLRGYDSHLIMQQIGKIAKNKSYVDKNGERKDLKINAIPNNMERYMAFTLGNNLTFIDSPIYEFKFG